MLSRICETFNCRPSEALNEDLPTVLAIMDLRAYAETKELVEQPDMDEDKLRKYGASERLISMVFENVERMSRDKLG